MKKLISHIKSKFFFNRTHIMREEDVERNYWEWQAEFAKEGRQDLSRFKTRQWIYRNCKDLVYTEGVQCFMSRYAMQEFIHQIERLIYHLHKNPYYDQYKVLLNISKDKNATFYIRNQYNNTLILSGYVPFNKTLPTMKVIVFQLHRVKDLSRIQRQCMNFDKNENIDYLYGLSLVSEKH